MIIPDTSIWVDLFRGGENLLSTGPDLSRRRLLHPFVFGELLLGGLPKDRVLRDALAALRPAPVGELSEVVAFIQWAKLAGTGIGYVDAHLLVSAKKVEVFSLLTKIFAPTPNVLASPTDSDGTCERVAIALHLRP